MLEGFRKAFALPSSKAAAENVKEATIKKNVERLINLDARSLVKYSVSDIVVLMWVRICEAWENMLMMIHNFLSYV